MSVLLPYQQKLFDLLDHHRVVVCEKSRRIGMTWSAAAYAVLQASESTQGRGSDVFYMGYNLHMAEEFFSAIEQWIIAFEATGINLMASGKKSTARLQRKFRSGYSIKALSSRPRSLRGRQGLVIIDEAAFHDDLGGLLKAALALLIWGGRLLIISTHYGRHNAFYQLIEAIQTGQYDYAHLRVSFDDALADGLYQRIAQMLNYRDSVQDQQQWVAQIRADYGDSAAEELDCIPGDHGGQYFLRGLLEQAATEKMTIFRVSFQHEQEAVSWIEQTLNPNLKGLRQDLLSCVGVDFGRHHDLSVFYVLQIDSHLSRKTIMVLELSQIPFEIQWKLLQALLIGLPRLQQVGMDKGGIGGYLHEKAEQFFGSSCVFGIQLSRHWYADIMPRLRVALEQKKLSLAQDSLIIEDLCHIALLDNVPRPYRRHGNRHADAAIALALAYQASMKSGHQSLEIHQGAKRTFTQSADYF